MENARTFTVRLADLLARERTALGEFLVTLAEFDRRRLWLELGYGSLFDFLHRELGLSKGAAFYRKTAVALIQRFPEVVEPLRDGRLCLMSVAELARVLTEENRGEVLPRFFRVSKREAQALAAELRPVETPARRQVISTARVPVEAPLLALAAPPTGPFPVQPVEPTRRSATPDEGVTGDGDGHGLANANGRADAQGTARMTGNGDPRGGEPAAVGGAPLATPPLRTPPASAQPLTAELSRLHVTVSRRFLEKLEEARAALSHSHPGAGADEILEAGLDLLLERHAKRRGIVKTPRREPPPSAPGYIPAHVRREVWERDQGRCQWPLEGGGICGSTLRVEFDHRDPLGLGGLATVQTVRVLCRVHNDFAARRAYGNAWMDRFTRGGRGVPEVRLPP